MHQEQIHKYLPKVLEFFKVSKTEFIHAWQSQLENLTLMDGDSSRSMKLQWNKVSH